MDAESGIAASRTVSLVVAVGRSARAGAGSISASSKRCAPAAGVARTAAERGGPRARGRGDDGRPRRAVAERRRRPRTGGRVARLGGAAVERVLQLVEE